jgi:hypothetical protein
MWAKCPEPASTTLRACGMRFASARNSADGVKMSLLPRARIVGAAMDCQVPASYLRSALAAATNDAGRASAARSENTSRRRRKGRANNGLRTKRRRPVRSAMRSSVGVVRPSARRALMMAYMPTRGAMAGWRSG